MALASLIIGIIGLVLGFIAFIIASLVFNAYMTNSPIQGRSDKPNIPESFEEGFSAGTESIITTLNLAIFDMFRKLEVLDYETQISEILERMNEIAVNEELRESIVNDLIEYRKGQENGTDNY